MSNFSIEDPYSINPLGQQRHKSDRDSNGGYDPYNSSQHGNPRETNITGDNGYSTSYSYRDRDSSSYKGHTQQSPFYEPSIFALSGRIGRLRFLAYSLVITLLNIKLVTLVEIQYSSTSNTLLYTTYIAFLMLHFIVATRRLNDMDKSGWMSLLLFIPIANLALSLYLLFNPGTSSPNRYGAMPAPANNLGLGVFIVIVLVAIGAVVRDYATEIADNGYSEIKTAGLSQFESSDDIGNYVPASDADVILYGTSWCGYCRKTREYLADNDIDYVDYDIESSVQGAKEYKQLHGRGVPLLVVNTKVIRGYNPRAIEAALDAESE